MVEDAKNSEFAKFHANQSLVLFIFSLIIGIALPTILAITIVGIILIPFVPVIPIIFGVIGMINASKLEMKELPLIGGIHLLDK